MAVQLVVHVDVAPVVRRRAETEGGQVGATGGDDVEEGVEAEARRTVWTKKASIISNKDEERRTWAAAITNQRHAHVQASTRSKAPVLSPNPTRTNPTSSSPASELLTRNLEKVHATYTHTHFFLHLPSNKWVITIYLQILI